MSDSGRPIFEEGDAVEVEQKPATKEPQLYRVILHNDDYTTMDFVVHVLTEYFHKSRTEATQIMLQIHTKGKGLCGEYTRDLAQTKVDQVTLEAQAHKMPLLCTMEPA